MSDSFVLCYHAVSPTWEAPLSITPDRLERELSWLLRRGWCATTFTDVVVDRPAGRCVAVTFDDAFASVIQLAHPILDSLGIPATVFAPTAFMSSRCRLSWPGIEQWADSQSAPELESMSWEDLGALADAGWEIGSHTRTHPHLTRLGQNPLHRELTESRDEVARRLGRACTSIAYPYGDVDQRVADAARAAGYGAGAALSSRLPPLGPLRWPRVGIYNADTWPRFLLKASRPMRTLRASRLWPS